MQYIVFLVGVCLCVFFSRSKLQFSGGMFFVSWSIMSSDKLESFPIQFTGKNYSAWEFQFKLFVKGKELCGHIDGSVPAPQGAKAFCLSGKFMMLGLGLGSLARLSLTLFSI